MYKFPRSAINWVEFRKLPDLMERDYHWSGEIPTGCYHENMQLVWDDALKCLKQAQDEGKKFLLLTHGHSTSRIGKTTSRSQIRKLMQSKVATPYIVRKNCIEHSSVFVAAIKPKLPISNEL